jgi:hypothetical protein
MPPPTAMLVPFPCAVYSRDRAGMPYMFSHLCTTYVHKVFPQRLGVTELRAYDSMHNWTPLRQACFMVLVAGDVAQEVSVGNQLEKRTRFLFDGSIYSRRGKDAGNDDLLHTEFHESCVPLRFYGTLATFDAANVFHSAVPIESGVALFPRQVQETDVCRMATWVEKCILKTIHSSVWVTELGDSYNEHTLRLASRTVMLAPGAYTKHEDHTRKGEI